jgi:hypothetical protein
MAGEKDPEATGPTGAVNEPGPAPFEPLTGPELVFGVTGAIGTDLTLVCSVLKEILREVRYDDAEIIRLSDLLRAIEGNEGIPRSPVDIRTEQLMDAVDTLRRLLACGDAVALLGIPEIRARRKALTGDAGRPASEKGIHPALAEASGRGQDAAANIRPRLPFDCGICESRRSRHDVRGARIRDPA